MTGRSWPGRGLDQERVQELPGHAQQAGMDLGAETGAGAGGKQGRHGGGGPDPKEQRRQLGGSVTAGMRTLWSEMSEEGWGDGPQLQWAPEEQVPDGTAAPSDHRGRAGGAAARPPESTQRIHSPNASILPLLAGHAEPLKTHHCLLSPSK